MGSAFGSQRQAFVNEADKPLGQDKGGFVWHRNSLFLLVECSGKAGCVAAAQWLFQTRLSDARRRCPAPFHSVLISLSGPPQWQIHIAGGEPAQNCHRLTSSQSRTLSVSRLFANCSERSKQSVQTGLCYSVWWPRFISHKLPERVCVTKRTDVQRISHLAPTSTQCFSIVCIWWERLNI